MPIADALALARQQALDLVEINPQGRPPVCKVCDYESLSDYLWAKTRTQAGRKPVELEIRDNQIVEKG
jgi:translation initiation factor IF-3